MALFTKKDLGLLLPDDTPGDPLSLRYTDTKEKTEVFKPLKPQVDPSKKVVRYRAGQVPKYAHGYEGDRGFVTSNSQVRMLPKTNKHKTGHVISTGRKRVEARIMSSSVSEGNNSSQKVEMDALYSGKEESGKEDVAKALQDSSSDEEDDSDIDRRRQMLRCKVKEREAQKEKMNEIDELNKRSVRQPVVPENVTHRTVAALPPTIQNGNLETSSSSSSEYETATDDSEASEELMKPVFVPKKARGTMKLQEELAAEEKRREKQEQEKQKMRKMESRRLVAEDIRREQNTTIEGCDTDVEMPDDTDGLDPAQEYRDWELREMRRIKRDRDRKEQKIKEEAEALRRRNMTQEERTAEDAKLKKNEPKQKKKLKFMQKYYHKGAFYVDDDSIRSKNDVRTRDATEATLEDKFNKEMLPSVMQVKNFGRAGRTKYTHLADQDTSSRNSLWARDDGIRKQYKSHLGGMKDIDGSMKRRRKE